MVNMCLLSLYPVFLCSKPFSSTKELCNLSSTHEPLKIEMSTQMYTME